MKQFFYCLFSVFRPQWASSWQFPVVKIPYCGGCCRGYFHFFWLSIIFTSQKKKYQAIFGSAAPAAERFPGKIPCVNIAVPPFLIQKLFNTDFADFFDVGQSLKTFENSVLFQSSHTILYCLLSDEFNF